MNAQNHHAAVRLHTHAFPCREKSLSIRMDGADGNRSSHLIGTGYTGTIRYVYGEDGKLIGEYDNTGAAAIKHVYLQDTPIAALKGTGAYLVQADHLNTPRAILGAANALVWKWDSDPFGGTAANENPSALGTFNYNLRFPGQYYDKETTLHYNYLRDIYNPKIGRYFESDPIGLAGGINTYAYVGGNPISKADPMGLVEWKGTVKSVGLLEYGQDNYSLESECVNGYKAIVEIQAKSYSFGKGIQATYSSASFKDPFNYLNPYVFDGPQLKVSAGVSVGVGGGFSVTTLGGAQSPGSFGAEVGLDLSAGPSVGNSKVQSAEQVPCTCSTK